MSEPAGLPTYYTKAEAAKIARVTPRTIGNWIRDGRLKAGGGPGIVLIKPEWLEEAIEGGKDDE